jgi:hypothetical protein
MTGPVVFADKIRAAQGVLTAVIKRAFLLEHLQEGAWTVLI